MREASATNITAGGRSRRAGNAPQRRRDLDEDRRADVERVAVKAGWAAGYVSEARRATGEPQLQVRLPQKWLREGRARFSPGYRLNRPGFVGGSRI